MANMQQADIKITARKLSNDKPTPLDFDTFIPWICKQWQMSTTVEVTRMYQEKYINKDKRRSSSTYSKSTKSIKYGHDEYETETKKNFSIQPIIPATPITKKNKDLVPLIAYYNTRGNLVEISLIGSHIVIHKKIIQAIHICIPFHTFLNKLTISKGGVTCSILCEIKKLLPQSNLTDICLDNSCMPEGNYYILLDQTSQLKSLSLNRCNINDVVCIEIATRIDYLGPAHSSLLVLELGSNFITDIGARHLGNILRRNRRLLHLNLSGNRISDVGMGIILKHLMEFKLTAYERFDSARRKVDYTENKDRIFEKCMDDVKDRQNIIELSTRHLNKKKASLKSNKSSTKSKKNMDLDERSATELVIALAKDLMVEYEDPFNTVKKDGCYYSLGNMVLCSLNVSYNELTYASIKLLDTVLSYQSHIILKPSHSTGLIRVALMGNYIPKYCFEYERMSMNLKNVVNNHIPFNTGKRTHSAIRK